MKKFFTFSLIGLMLSGTIVFASGQYNSTQDLLELQGSILDLSKTVQDYDNVARQRRRAYYKEKAFLDYNVKNCIKGKISNKYGLTDVKGKEDNVCVINVTSTSTKIGTGTYQCRIPQSELGSYVESATTTLFTLDNPNLVEDIDTHFDKYDKYCKVLK